MCGIAGIFVKEGTPDQASLLDALSVMRHRGPEDIGLHLSGQIGLAFTRLSIIDLDHGQQPIYSSDNNLCLIGNGEIYNYIELRQQLIGKGYRFITQSDFEPILYAYQEYGLNFLDHLEGMFAFALYDQRHNRLLLARDRLGIKPLFIARKSEGTYFGSELKVLFALQKQPRPSVDPVGLVQYLQSGFATTDATLCQGIERLLPGEAMLIESSGRCRCWRYWAPQWIEPRASDFEDAAGRFDTLITDVMRKHLRSDVPFGLFLSGGIDSTTLLALTKAAGAQPQRTYSIGFPGSDVFNELSDAQRIARHFQVEHVTIELDEQTVFERMPYMVFAADELIDDYAGLALSYLAERAAADVKVVFTGDGGDEAFAGYSRYRKIYLQRWLRNLRRPGSGGFRAKPGFTQAEVKTLFNSHLVRANTIWRQPFIASWQAAPKSWSDLQRMQTVDIDTVLPDRYLVKTDRMTMAWGLEARVPLLDHQVIEFGLALPDQLKIQGRQGKIFLRRWAQRWLPVDHLQLRKRGLSVPVDQWPSGARLPRLERVLLGNAGIREWFKPAGIQQLIAAQYRHPSSKTRQKLLRLLQFAIWHRLFIEGNGVTVPEKRQDPLNLLDT
ncbi:MAG: asparagine synthase (glutamine-hydrolyzing) [Gammaproteobacteria bacterium]|nr:asparagine synthase (glutamine-hydrolyzing) [Candidatus Competibacteraceae bacterium]MCP5195201.1 asparagine synthase (glutamine-hydrolyzing) [Gammaproteobacteria bacterium]